MIILLIILGMAAALWGVNSLRGPGYGTMVKTYIKYWLNPVDLDKYEPLQEGMTEWLEEDTLLAHAMGGIDESVYTNSLEAFKTAYENGFRVYEVDLVVTKEGEVICSHEYLDENGEVIEYSSFMQKKIEDKYTPVDLGKLIDLMEDYPDVYIMTGQDIFGRDAKFECVEIDETYPKYLLEHIEEYDFLIMPRLNPAQMKMTKFKMKVKRVGRRLKRGVKRLLGRK